MALQHGLAKLQLTLVQATKSMAFFLQIVKQELSIVGGFRNQYSTDFFTQNLHFI
jgi:hypothetical protein